MRTITSRCFLLIRMLAGLAVAAGMLVVPLGTSAAHAAPVAAAGVRADLPPGVVRLNDSEPCPLATLCLYRDYRNQGPAYGIGAGYPVVLRDLPMPGGVNGNTAANNVSSWVNNTRSLALLIDIDADQIRPLLPGHQLQEPNQNNDTVDDILWV